MRLSRRKPLGFQADVRRKAATSRRTPKTHGSSQNIFDEMPVDVGQPEVAALEAERQTLVIQA